VAAKIEPVMSKNRKVSYELNSPKNINFLIEVFSNLGY